MSEAVQSGTANPSATMSIEDEDEDILRISNAEHQGIPIVVAQGDVDLSTTPTLRLALDAACSVKPESKMVAVDIRQVPFIDSAGLALLVEIRKRYIEDCRLALVIEHGSQPERVLKLGRFDTFLKVVYAPDDLDASSAVAAG